MSEQADQPTISIIEKLIEQQDYVTLQALLEQVHPADIADLLDELNQEYAIILFGLLDVELASEVLDETRSLVRQDLVEGTDDERLADILDELPEDDAAEFLEGLPDEYAESLLDLMDPVGAEEVRELLSYEDETVGRLMSTNVARLRRQWSVAEALEYLRSLEDREIVHYLYVVNQHNQLIGIAPLRNIVMSQPEKLIADIMSTDLVSVQVTADQEEMAEMVAKYDYVSIPVVDSENRFLGVVTVDDVLDVLEDEMTEDIQRLGGSEPLTQPYFNASVLEVVQKRIIWLLFLFVAATFTGGVIKSYDSLLEQFRILSAFIPLITGTGGNAGSQTVATIIRAMAVGEVQVRLGDLRRAWLREVTVGLLLGLLLGMVGFFVAPLFNTLPNSNVDNLTIALIIAFALPAVVMWANTTATVVPIIAERLGIDAAVVSAPMITTIVDATGLFIYFSIAQRLLL